MEKEKIYLICDRARGNYQLGALDIQVELLGDAVGRVVNEKGETIGGHWSSSIGWLRSDLLNGKAVKEGDYEIVDLIGKPVPERFKIYEPEEDGWVYF